MFVPHSFSKCSQTLFLLIELLNWKKQTVVTFLRVDVFQPNGKEHKLYTRNLLTNNGRAERNIPFVLNDDVDQWSIIMREVVSGNKAEINIEFQ